MKDYNVQHIRLDQIDRNPLNPRGRGDPGDIKELLKSISNSGLYYPILVNRTDDDRYQIIEGHRRYAVFQIRRSANPEYASIPALVIEVGQEYLTKIFREINDTAKKLNGRQWLDVYALGGKADDMPTRLAPSIKALGAMFDPKELLDLARRAGPSVHGLARRVATFCGIDPDNQVDLRRVVAWLINSEDSVNVRITMKEGSAEEVKHAINGKHRLDGKPFPDGELVAYARPVHAQPVAAE